MLRQILISYQRKTLSNFAEEFLKALTFSDNDRMIIKKATMGQHKNKSWHEMRHILVTEKNKISLYPTKH